MVGEHQCTGPDIEKEDCRSDPRCEKQGGGSCKLQARYALRRGGGGGGCCLAEEGEEPYMKWLWGGGLQPHPPVSVHGVLYFPTIMYVTDL